MATPRIAIDIDDVLADSTEALRQLVNERTGSQLTREHYKAKGEYWGYYERVWREHGITMQYSGVEAVMAADQSHVPLLPGAELAIHELSKKFHIILITARPAEWEQATRKWLKHHFAHDDVEMYFSNSHLDAASKTKGQLCQELGVSLLIDDNVQHCVSARAEGIKAILFGEYGWHVTVPADLPNCKDWQSVLEYVEDGNRR